MDPGSCDVVCRDCGSNQKLHYYPCRHCFCSVCLIKFNFMILKSFKMRLDKNIEELQGKSSFLGCKLKCPESRLSMSLEHLQGKLSDSQLNDLEKQEFNEIASISTSFFSGINTNFFICNICKMVKFCVEEKPLICKDCIKGICLEQLKIYPPQLFYDLNISDKEFEEKSNLFGNDYFLVEYNSKKRCYDFKTFNNEGQKYHRITKLKKIAHNSKAMLVRGIQLNSDEDYFYIEKHEDLQTICIFTFLSN